MNRGADGDAILHPSLSLSLSLSLPLYLSRLFPSSARPKGDRAPPSAPQRQQASHTRFRARLEAHCSEILTVRTCSSTVGRVSGMQARRNTPDSTRANPSAAPERVAAICFVASKSHAASPKPGSLRQRITANELSRLSHVCLLRLNFDSHISRISTSQAQFFFFHDPKTLLSTIFFGTGAYKGAKTGPWRSDGILILEGSVYPGRGSHGDLCCCDG